MARRKKSAQETEVSDYRYDSKRKNNPPAGLAAHGQIWETPKVEYAYNPHLPPCLRFDDTGRSDQLPELLATAKKRPLSDDEAKTLANALKKHEPWLEWTGKQEKKGFAVDPVALHIHERISAQAIIKVAAREDVQPDLFANPQLEYQKAVQFYQHDVDWSNRMILGDSLQVMTSLARREDLAGKVQMIYMDPPYGIKFASNFQPEVGKRDVKDKEQDLTREPEMIKAYRDTWTLGVHSYLAYLRDRLILSRELLSDSGSIFVQISDENVQRLRLMMDEVYGSHNFVSQITFRTKIPLRTTLLANVSDYVLWYAKDSSKLKYHKLFDSDSSNLELFNYIDTDNGYRGSIQEGMEDGKRFASLDLSSSGATPSCIFSWEFNGKNFNPTTGKSWKTNREGMARLVRAERLFAPGSALRYVLYYADYPVGEKTSLWNDTLGSGGKVYVVQTNTKVIERCLLMTTAPGDLVLDPTCGSGTTAYVAEQWGRRWITIDTSRVALAIARQRLLTSKFDYYELKNENAGIESGFIYKTVPHITLKSIAQNPALDPIFDRHQKILDAKLAELNAELAKVDEKTRQKLALKLYEKQEAEGKSSISDADKRRWLLPKVKTTPSSLENGRKENDDGIVVDLWQDWEVPFDTDPDWPEPLQKALVEYRKAWRAKMDEVNACISANADQEELVDQPKIVPKIVRVSGPFTMEGVIPVEDAFASPIGGTPEELETFGSSKTDGVIAAMNAEAYLDKMLRLLKNDGVRFPNNKIMKFISLEFCGGEFLHADGEWKSADESNGIRKVAVSFGPEHGAVTGYQVQNALRSSFQRGHEDLVFAGFSFDSEAQAIISEDNNPKVHCHLAHITPDVNMGDLLKGTRNSQLFTVFGSPRTKITKLEDGQFQIEMEGVDIYNPIENAVEPTAAEKVAAWFVDSDYDGMTFCITQAFFPDKGAWAKLSKSLKGTIDEEVFEKFSGTVSLPFPMGKNKKVAVKVIDPRGNEVMSVHRLDGKY